MLLTGIILLAAININGNPVKKENIFNRLTNDGPDGKAVLVFSVKAKNSAYNISGGYLCFSRNALVYNCQMSWFNAKRDKETKQYSGDVTYYYTVDPGELDINLIDVETISGSYTKSFGFPLSGRFKLEAGSIYYLGEVEVDLSKSTFAIFQGESAITSMSNSFKKDFPAIYNSVNGKINLISLTPSVPFETVQTIFTDDFSQSNINWQFTNDNYHKTSISDGKMLIENQATDSCVVLKNVEFAGSFEVQAKYTWVSGENNKAFGLIIGNDPTACLKFSITTGGYFSIFRWLPKNDLKWIAQNAYNWTKTDLIHTNPGEKNIIQIQKTNWFLHNVGMIAFYINGSLVARNNYYIYPPVNGSGTQFKKEGVVGFYSYGKQTIALDNFKLSALGE